MRPILTVWCLLGSLPTSLALAQATVFTVAVPLHPRKVVAHDYGNLWHGALVIRDDVQKSVSELGNPWLGGGSRHVTTGVNDMARLDALTPGAVERVALVGDGFNLQFAHWDSVERDIELMPVALAETAGAQMVRAAPFAPQHLIVTVKNQTNPTSTTMRLYRYHPNGTFALVASPAVAGPVLDVEIVRTATNAARILYRTATGVTCIEPGGNVVWSVTGTDGVFARWPLGAPIVWAVWVHHIASSGNWQLTLLRDTGVMNSFDLGPAITGDVQAAFAADADHDGDVDLVVRSDAGIAVVDNQRLPTNPEGDDFQQMTVVAVPDSDPGMDCVPDLLITHAGRRLRVLDTDGADKVLWRRVDLPFDQVDDPDGMDLQRYLLNGEDFGGSVPYEGETTRIDFRLDTAPGFLAPFAPDGVATTANIQVVAWRQELSTGGAPLELSETNDVFPLDPLFEPGASNWWQLHMTLAPDCHGPLWPQASPPVWDGVHADWLYWVAIRIVNTSGLALNSASEPIMLVTTLSPEEGGNWAYINNNFCQVANLTKVQDRTGQSDGGVLVGVIERIRNPPPPPPGGIPTPKVADHQPQVSPNVGQ